MTSKEKNKKLINRADLRGKPLDNDCKTAHICSIELDTGIKICHCYGIIDCYTDDYLEKCKTCKAFEGNIPSIW